MPVLGHLPVTDDTFHEDDPYIHHHANGDRYTR